MPSAVINSLKQQLNHLGKNKHIWVAYSGGVDSHVLLHALAQLKKEYEFSLGAIHVNHQLNAAAKMWAAHCVEVCESLGINCQTLTVKVQTKARRNLEEAARNVRYKALKTCLKDNHYLVTAHHADDQAETFFLQLLRGAGTKGLSAMPLFKVLGNGFLWRPLLSLSRDTLMAYATFYALKWIEDDSNAETHFDRNYLRHQVISPLKIRWPYLVDNIYQSARHCSEAESLLEELALEDLNALEEGRKLNIPKLRSLSRIRRHNVLRYWLRRQGFPLPARVHLHQFEEHFMDARWDASPKLCWATVQLRRYRDGLYALPNPYHELSAKSFKWKLTEPLPLERRTLIAEQRQGEGIQINLINASEGIEICFRQGGESIQLMNYGHSRSLKKWLQDFRIPPWERGRIPLVYINGKLAQVLISSRLCIAKQFAAKPHEMGWVIGFF